MNTPADRSRCAESATAAPTEVGSVMGHDERTEPMGCEWAGCDREATHIVRLCVQNFMDRWGGQVFDDRPYCTEHAHADCWSVYNVRLPIDGEAA